LRERQQRHVSLSRSAVSAVRRSHVQLETAATPANDVLSLIRAR
jgi:hypothetical protein